MTNYEKLCEILAIKKLHECQTYDECPLGLSNPCDICDCESYSLVFPDFTAKKQIEMIKLIADITQQTIEIDKTGNYYNVQTIEYSTPLETEFSEALAGLALQLVEAGELDKEEAKRILE